MRLGDALEKYVCKIPNTHVAKYIWCCKINP